MIADLTAKALSNAHRFEMLHRSSVQTHSDELRRTERHRVALLAFLRRLIDRADSDKLRKARERLEQASGSKES